MGAMAKRETVLSVTDLMKKYGDHVIVDNFNLTVSSGQAIALTGRNGSGKSTVLRCIIGADRPSEGRVEAFGRKVSETDHSRPCEPTCSALTTPNGLPTLLPP